MSVAVLVPFRAGCGWRERSWAFVHRRYEAAGYEVVVGTSAARGFSRTQAILDARAQTDADVFVIADADVFGAGIEEGIEHARQRGWAVPHGLLHRLAPASTQTLLQRPEIDWRALPLSTDNPQDSKPYRVHEGGTLLITTAEAFDTAPPDPRFVGWGQEDDAWAATLRALVGKPWRGTADLAHLWHPAEPRKSRAVGNEPNRRLLRRYQSAKRSPALMAALVEEGRSWQASTSAQTAGASTTS